MPSKNRLESLRKKLTKVVGSEDLKSLADAPESTGEHLESALGNERLDVINRDEEALRKLGDGDFAHVSDGEMSRLEAIVEREGRQVAFIVGGMFEGLPDPWTHFNSPSIRALIGEAIPAIGRVERMSPSGRRTDHVGTGFVVGPRLMMTNRHVAEVFVRGAGAGPLIYNPGGAFDFGREKGFTPTDLEKTLKITGVKMVHPFWDMALLELADLPGTVKPLKLSALAPEEIVGREIATIGYPGRGNDRSPGALELEAKHFGNTFGVKRIAPGEIDGRETTTSFRHPVPAMTHDCSTLAGNSGSAVLDVTTGEVVGLHFKGITLKVNYSVPLYELARDGRVLDAGVSFTKSVPATDAWESWWKGLPGVEAAVKRPKPVVRGMSFEKEPEIEADGSYTWTVPITISVSLGGEAGAAGLPAEGAEESF
jgi:endonuclease G, mitochondrial